MANLLDTLIAALGRTRTPRTGIRALVLAYLRFVETEPAQARFIHASAYAGFVPAHPASITTAKAPRIERMLAWLRPHAEAGRVVDLPDSLTEMLLIGPVAQTARQRLAGDPAIDLRQACRHLPEHIWQSLRGPHA
ncbi:hypothetical protein [Streptomyces sp. 7N604]|uniref:hypothetical protein n=1 Tax=Streptomyces sp. 7N604 TaxID=3457415 RepID=UPI003FCFD4F2